MANVIGKFERPEIVAGYRQFIAEFPNYVELSRDTADEAESWRDFEVGDVGVCLEPGTAGLRTLAGANFKWRHTEQNEHDKEWEDPTGLTVEHEVVDWSALHDVHDIPTDIPKVCAEMATILQCESDVLFFVGHVITASTNPREIAEVTGMNTRTLAPCQPCVQSLDACPQTSRATLYASAGLYENIFQVRNIRMLRRYYESGVEPFAPLCKMGRQATQAALAYFDYHIDNHEFNERYFARTISSIARSALAQTTAD